VKQEEGRQKSLLAKPIPMVDAAFHGGVVRIKIKEKRHIELWNSP
jgi:hypothetical protein